MGSHHPQPPLNFNPLMKRTLLALALLATTSITASAHSLWIEALPDNGGVGVRFAQWGDEYEVSPGNLDAFIEVSGWVLNEKGEPVSFDVAKKHDHFFLGEPAAGQTVFAQAQFTVRQLHADKPARAPLFYTRFMPEGWAEGKPALTMDVVPTATPGEARVYFRRKPLPNADMLFFSPKVTDEKLKTDAEGFVRAPDISKPGPYLLAIARYSEELPGFFRGVPYGITSHSASLYWTVKEKN